jgi:hypothetical protein
MHLSYDTKASLKTQRRTFMTNTQKSMLDLFAMYGGNAVNAQGTVNGKQVSTQRATIGFAHMRVFLFEHSAVQENTGFFLVNPSERKRVYHFFASGLRPRRYSRASSPWRDAGGGVDFLVDAQRFHRLVQEHTGLTLPPTPALQLAGGFVTCERVMRQPLSLGYGLGVERDVRALDRITLHHTVSGQTPPIDTVNRWWLNRADGSSWSRGGYHFLIRGDGEIWQLLPVHAIANGSLNPRGHRPAPNARSIHISFAGSFTPETLPTQEAIDAFVYLARGLLASDCLPSMYSADGHVVGHREWAATACPGFTRQQYLSWLENPK